MAGFEGIGDFDSSDPWQRYSAHQAAKGNWPTTCSYEDVDESAGQADDEETDAA